MLESFRSFGMFCLGSLACGCLGPIGDELAPFDDPRVGTGNSEEPRPRPSEDPPLSPNACGALVEQRAHDPSCEYTFDVESCSATWECADGRVIEMQVRYDVSYGAHRCASEMTCEGPGEVALEECRIAPSEPLACPVEDEARALELCGPTMLVPVDTDCPSPVDAVSSAPG